MSNRVIEIVLRETGAKYVTETTSIEDLGLDSLDFVDLLVKISAETGVEIPTAKYGTIQTIGDLIRATEK